MHLESSSMDRHAGDEAAPPELREMPGSGGVVQQSGKNEGGLRETAC